MSNELNNDVNLNNDIILLEDKLANLKMRRVRYHELYFIYLSRKLNGKKKREIKTALEKVFNIKLKTNRHLFYSTTYNFHASPLDDIPVIRIISVNNAGIVLHIFWCIFRYWCKKYATRNCFYMQWTHSSTWRRTS